MEYRYDIVLESDLGERRGSLALRGGPGGLEGTLELLHTVNAVGGTLDAQGRVELSGRVRTLLQSIPFTASGRLDARGIELTLRFARRSFPLHGTAKGA